MENIIPDLVQALGVLAMALYLLIKHLAERKNARESEPGAAVFRGSCPEHHGLVKWMERIDHNLTANTQKTGEVAESVKRIEGALGL